MTLSRRQLLRTSPLAAMAPMSGFSFAAVAAAQPPSQTTSSKTTALSQQPVHPHLLEYALSSTVSALAAMKNGEKVDYSALAQQHRIMARHCKQIGLDAVIKARATDVLARQAWPQIDSVNPVGKSEALKRVQTLNPKFSASDVPTETWYPTTPDEWRPILTKASKTGLSGAFLDVSDALESFTQAAPAVVKVSGKRGQPDAHLEEVCNSWKCKLAFLACLAAIAGLAIVIGALIASYCGSIGIAVCFGLAAYLDGYVLAAYGIAVAALLNGCSVILAEFDPTLRPARQVLA